jgi:hypothetical protein
MDNPALAERLAAMATGLLRTQELTPELWNYCESLLQASVRLAGDEPRFTRFLAEAAMRTGDLDTALDALNKYRAQITLQNKTDEPAQVQVIELYLAKMDGADARLKYLQQIIDAPQVSAAVRSVAAVKAAQIRAERLESAKAADLIDRAIELNSMNLEALRIRLAIRPPRTNDQAVSLYLQMIRANPAQPQLGIAVARVLAGAGLAQPAMEWFNQSLDLHQRMGITPPPDVGVDYAAQFYLSGDPRRAFAVAAQLTQQNPQDLNAWLLQLILAKASGDKEALAKTIQQANVAVYNRIAVIKQSAGDKTATTRPIDSPDVQLPDPAADLQRLAADKRPELVAQYAPIVAGVAWMHIYFDDKPAAAQPWLRAMAGAVAPNDEVLTRLQGWSYLAAGNKDEAKVKLSAVSEADPVSALGLLLMSDDKSPQARERIAAEGRKLLADNPSGLTGALLLQALSPYGVKVTPGPTAGKIEKELDNFPKQWMRIVDQPQAFYSLRLEPVRAGVQLYEPALVQVTVSNTGNFALTLGPDGVLHSDVWLDAMLRGAQQQQFPAEAYERLAGPMVLKPGDKASAVVRLDQRGLAGVLEQFPNAAFQIGAAVMTNPTTVGGNVTIGAAGQRAGMAKLMQRSGANIADPNVRQQLVVALQNGTPSEKVRAIETLAWYAPRLAQQDDQQAKAMAGVAAEGVRREMNDADPSVAAWSTYLYTALTGDKNACAAMLKDGLWLTRMLGAVAIDYTNSSKDLLVPLAQNDPDPAVRRLARAAQVVKIHVGGGATQPAATQPAAAPTTPPAPAAPTAPTAP